ncbi:MAG: putative rane protein [Frankiales bacterium]|jgi:putative membrane protein|nr:putative rane protein [Frankiales bacterium]
MMWWNHGGWAAGDWLAMSLTMVLIWGLLAALVVWTVRSTRDGPESDGSAATPTARADEVLAERLARGEIDADEFTRRRELLHSGSDHASPAG